MTARTVWGLLCAAVDQDINSLAKLVWTGMNALMEAVDVLIAASILLGLSDVRAEQDSILVLMESLALILMNVQP